jgi:hypothetical protein
LWPGGGRRGTSGTDQKGYLYGDLRLTGVNVMSASVQNTRSALADHIITLTKGNAFLVPGRTGKKSNYQAARTVLDHLYQRVAVNDADDLVRGHVMPSAVSVPAIALATGLSDYAVRGALEWLDGLYIEVTRNSAREVTDILVRNLDQLVAHYKPLGRGISGKDGDSVEDIRATLYDRMTEDTEAGAFAGHQAARTALRWCIHHCDASRQVVTWMVKHLVLNMVGATGLAERAVRDARDWLHANGFITLTESTGGRHRYVNAIQVHHTGQRRHQARMETAPRKAVVSDLANDPSAESSDPSAELGDPSADVTSSSSLSPAQQPIVMTDSDDLEAQADIRLRLASGGTSGGRDSLRSPAGQVDSAPMGRDGKARSRLVARDDEYEAAEPLLAWLWLDDDEPRVSLLRSRNGNRQRRTKTNSLKLVKITSKERHLLLSTKRDHGDGAHSALVEQLHDRYLDPAQPDLFDHFYMSLPMRPQIPERKLMFWMGKRSRANGETPYFWSVEKRQERIVSDEKLVKLSPDDARWLKAIAARWDEGWKHPDYDWCEDADEAYSALVSDLYDEYRDRPNESVSYFWRESERAAARRDKAADTVTPYVIPSPEDLFVREESA